MAVELGASRLLAPYFSSSQVIYTIIIGTVMIAMALGNLYGGRSADRDPDPAAIYRRMLIAGLWIAAVPFAGRYIILLISGLLILSVNTGFLTAAAFASCLALSLQNIGLAHVNPAPASLLLATESVFGVIFAVLLLSDVLTPFIIFGFVLIGAAIVVNEALPSLRKK